MTTSDNDPDQPAAEGLNWEKRPSDSAQGAGGQPGPGAGSDQPETGAGPDRPAPDRPAGDQPSWPSQAAPSQAASGQQYGQQGQYGQQYGQPGQPGQQYGQYGQPAPYGYPAAAPAPYGAPPSPFPPLPPGVEPASHGRRIGAYFLAIPLIIATLVIGYLIWGLVLWTKGTSPALRVLGMRPVDAERGHPIGFWRMVLRDVVGGLVQGILGVITGLVSFILFLTTAKRQSLPDMIGTTVVVYDPNRTMG